MDIEDKTKEELKSELRESLKTNISLEVLKGEKAKALIIANKELIFQNEEKEKRVDELVIIIANAARTTNELQVYQIELEAQNNELKAEIELAESNSKKYINLYENSPTAYLTLSNEGEIIELNPMSAKLLGNERPQLLNSRFGFFIVNNDISVFNLFLEKIFKTNTTATCELSLINHTKQSIQIILSGVLIANTQQCALNMIDITEANVMKALQQSKEQYDKLVKNIPVGVYIAHNIDDKTFIYDLISPRMAEIFNESVENMLVGKNFILNKIHNDDIENFKTSYMESIHKKCIFQWQGRFLINGKIKWLYINSIPELKPGNDEILWNGIVVDITDDIQAKNEIEEINKKLIKVNSEKDRFFSIIAHDLRGPFSNFMGLTKIMAESFKTLSINEIEQFANSMEKSANNLYRLLENLLEWSKIQQGIIPFNPKLIALKMIVYESIEMTGKAAEKKEIKISYHFSADTEVYADSNILQTIFRNLISNAIKFTPRGGNIEISAQPNKDQELEILVKDTGIGMSQEMIANLFHIDIDTNRKGTDNEPSTGLGVIICKDFIEKHGGKLWVESEVGVGSSFYFTLPMSN